MGAPVCEVVDTQLHFGTLMPFRVGASIPLLASEAWDRSRPVSVARRPYFSMSAHRLAADTSADYATRSATDPGAKTMKRQDQLTAPERTSTAVTQCCLDRSGNRPATVLDQTDRLLRCNRSMFKSGARSSWRGERTLSPFCHPRRSPLALQKCYCRGGRRLRIFRYAWKGD
jgi:hypothetical protein